MTTQNLTKRINNDIYGIKAELCKRSFFYFVQTFWKEIIPDEPVYNWHMEYLCEELQKVIERANRKEDKGADTIINIPPGTSKSTDSNCDAPCVVLDYKSVV